MSRISEDELKPRNGHTLVVGIVCRISGCANQKEMSLEDQEDHAKERVAELYSGPVEFRIIATKAKGERLDRPELEEIEAALRSGVFDLFLFDDLSRLIRGGEASRLLGVGVDHGTRSICLDDGIDTADGTWEEDALNACSENVAHNERTSKRIKHKSMNRFKKFGGPTGRPIAGYTVPEGAKTYAEWQKVDEATPIVVEGKEILMQEPDFSIVADFFNERQFPVGPYCHRQNWNGPMVRNFYANPLLKGKPQRGAKHTVKRHETGRRISVKNPKGPTYFDAPHLAHLSEEAFDELQRLLAAAHSNKGRPKVNGVDPLAGQLRRHSHFPGVHSRCWYCGSHHVWGANGITGNLMCVGSREWHCWHTIGFSGEMLCERLVAAICNELPRLADFDEQFASLVLNGAGAAENRSADEWARLRRDEAALISDKEGLLAAIKQAGERPMLVQELDAVEAQERDLLLRRHNLERCQQRVTLPESPSALRLMLEDEFRRLAITSPAFGTLLRQLAPEIYVYAVRLIDGSHLLPRAKIRLNLAGTFPDLNVVPGLVEIFTRELTLDLFEPPQREGIRDEAVRLAAGGFGQKAIARKMASRPTATAVQRALALQRLMASRGLSSPYETVLEPPDDYPKLRRHKHPRYQFQTVDGYQRPAL
jgi:hypothetical protein